MAAPRPARPLALRMLLGALRVYLLVFLGMWALSDALVFPGVFARRGEAGQVEGWMQGVGAEAWVLPTPRGGRALAWRLDGGKGRVLLHFHGNAELAADHRGLGRWLAARGWDWVGVEYPGFAAAPGWPSPEAVDEVARAVWAELRRRGVPPERIVVQGRSVGGGPAVALVGALGPAEAPAGLVLESTYDSLEAMAWSRFPVFPVSLVVGGVYDNAGVLRGRGLPVFQVHATDDPVVPVERGRALHEAAPQGRWTELPRGGHYLDLDDGGALSQAWLAWLEERVPAAPG